MKNSSLGFICKIALKWKQQDTSDDKSTLVSPVAFQQISQRIF